LANLLQRLALLAVLALVAPSFLPARLPPVLSGQGTPERAAQQTGSGRPAHSDWQPLKPFSHKKHLALGNIAPVIARAIDDKTYLSPPGNLRAQLNTNNPCEACHRGISQSEQITRANMPQMADCLVCHDQVEPPFSCSFCHTSEAKLKPATHTAQFLDTHPKALAALGRETCAVCHGAKFRCLGCH
jgi:hypothetical protein